MQADDMTTRRSGRGTLAAGLALVMIGAAGGAAGLDWVRAQRAEAGVTPPAPAAAAAPAPAGEGTTATVTPRTDKPMVAKALSQAFAATARALRPSVVRVDVEKEGPRPVAGRRRLLPELPPGLERFFNFDFGDGTNQPEPGP